MAKSVETWFDALDRAERTTGMKQWDDRCKRIKRKYLYEDSQKTGNRKYQLLWSNTEQMSNSIYSKTPKGVVKRRYNDQDHVARVASQMLERAINFSLDTGRYDECFRKVRDDFLLYGRGTARVYYEPTYSTLADTEEDYEDAAGTEFGGKNTDGTRGASASEYDDSAAKSAVTGPEETAEKKQELEFENVRIAFVHRQDFLHDPARTWQEVNWVAFRAFMTKDEMRGRKSFNQDMVEMANVGNEKDEAKIDDYSGKSEKDDDDDTVAVWEIWDRKNDTVCWVAKGCDEYLEEGPPYLELDGFFPCPCPAYGTITNDSLIPVPDFTFYQDQAEEIDQLTARIGALTDALKLVGFYPGGPQGEGSPEIERAFRPGFENKMIAVQSWAAFKESGGGQAPVVFLPVEVVGKIIQGCVQLRQQIVEDVYQIIGLSDIMRGATDPNETAQAQQMKAQFGGVRLRDRQTELGRFCSDVCKLIGQIIAVHCSPQTVMKMTNMQLPTKQQAIQAGLQQMMQYRQQIAPQVQKYQMAAQQATAQGQQPPQAPQLPPPPVINQPITEEEVFALLKDDILRLFRIDIESESTIGADEQKERKDRTELIQAATQFAQVWGPIVLQQPMMAKLAGELLKFGIRAFRVGRELEEVIEETADNFEKMVSQSGGQQKPDPKAQTEMVKLQGLQIKSQTEIQKAQIEAESAQQEAQLKLAAVQLKAQGDARKAVLDAQNSMMDHQSNIVEMHQQAGIDAQSKQQDAALNVGTQAVQAGLQHHARSHQASIAQQQANQDMAQTQANAKKGLGS